MNPIFETSTNGGMADFYGEVTKAFHEHKGSDEIITFHGYDKTGTEVHHFQTNLINRTDGNCAKFKFY